MAQSTLIRARIVPLKKATVPAAVQYGIWHSFNDIETALLWSSATTNIALTPATVTLTGVSSSVTPGTANVAASPATVTTTPVAGTVTAAVSVSQAPATITTTPGTAESGAPSATCSLVLEDGTTLFAEDGTKLTLENCVVAPAVEEPRPGGRNRDLDELLAREEDELLLLLV